MSETKLRFTLNGQEITEGDVAPNTTLLNYLRQDLGLTGTKEGCAEGDCGACTVVMIDEGAAGGRRFRAVNACLILLPMVHGRRLYTVEGLKEAGEYHPVQSSLAEALGSQCGYCTPGIVMSMFEACYRPDMDADWKLDDQLCGNLCRCTGYRPIRDAARQVAGTCPDDRFSKALKHPAPASETLIYQAHGQVFAMPQSLTELWDVLATYPTHRFVQGATDLGLSVTKRHASFECLVSLERIAGLRTITSNAAGWRLGAASTLSDIEAATEATLKPLARMLRFFGARQIKNRGTLGGNVCNASPIGDMAPVLVALNATMVAVSAEGERRIGVDSFFQGYRQTALRPGEILGFIDIPTPHPAARMATYKVSRRRELDISAVCAAFMVQLDGTGRVEEVRLAYGGMAATTQRAHNVEDCLRGQPWTHDTVAAATARLADDFQPIDDHRASAWYRGTLAKNLLVGFFEESTSAGCKTLGARPVGTVMVEEGV